MAAAALLGACTSDLPAPNNYEPSSAGVSDSSGDLAIDCGEDPLITAVGADFSFTPVVDAPDGAALTFTATSLPDGLMLEDASTGEISGTLETEGEGMIELTVTDGTTGMGMATCPVTVNPALEVTPLDALPFCVLPGAGTLKDQVVDGTGTGDLEALKCFHDRSSGDGDLPAGISINEDTCEIEGSITETRYGTWVFIVRGEQDGASVHVPYCVTQDQPTAYAVTLDHSGLGDMGVDGTLIPVTRDFNGSAQVNFGGGGDPLFQVIDADSCGTNACFFGYSYTLNASPFDAEELQLEPSNLLNDDASGQPIGFDHELSIRTTAPVEEALQDRPWTVNIGLRYCIADNRGDPDDPDDGPCERGNIVINGEADFMVSILMLPQ